MSTGLCGECRMPYGSWTHKYYGWLFGEAAGRETPEERAVFSIIRDMTDRRGLRQEWDRIEPDLREEIIGTWVELVRAER